MTLKQFVNTVSVFAFLLLCGNASAELQKVDVLPASELDQAIEEVVSKPEYSWRMPRERKAESGLKENGFFEKFFERASELFDSGMRKLKKLLKKIRDWLRDLFEREPKDVKVKERDLDINWQDIMRIVLFCILGVAASVLGVQLYRLYKKGGGPKTEHEAVAVHKVPDLNDENVSADDLPSDEWMKLAHDMIGRGELRLGMRAMFLGCLADLAYHRHISIAAFKSNREYTRELKRRAHDRSNMINSFEDNVRTLECVWYGMHDVTQSMLDVFEVNQNKILDEAKTA